jgi:hypothetical protein
VTIIYTKLLTRPLVDFFILSILSISVSIFFSLDFYLVFHKLDNAHGTRLDFV